MKLTEPHKRINQFEQSRETSQKQASKIGEYLTRWSPVLDPPTIESHSAQ